MMERITYETKTQEPNVNTTTTEETIEVLGVVCKKYNFKNILVLEKAMKENKEVIQENLLRMTSEEYYIADLTIMAWQLVHHHSKSFSPNTHFAAWIVSLVRVELNKSAAILNN